MTFSLTRDDISRCTNSGRTRVRSMINTPFKLPFQSDMPGPSGGASRERFRLSDILARIKTKAWFRPEMEAMLAATDAAYRQEQLA